MKTEIEIPDDQFKALQYVAAKRRTAEQSDDEAALLPGALVLERLGPFLQECSDLMASEQKQAQIDKLVPLHDLLGKLAEATPEKREQAAQAAQAVLDNP